MAMVTNVLFQIDQFCNYTL